MEEFAAVFSFWSYEDMENDITGFFASDIATLISVWDSTDVEYFASLFEYATIDEADLAYVSDYLHAATTEEDFLYIATYYATDAETFVTYFSGGEALSSEDFYAHFDSDAIEISSQDVLTYYGVTAEEFEALFAYSDANEASLVNFYEEIIVLETLDEVLAVFE